MAITIASGGEVSTTAYSEFTVSNTISYVQDALGGSPTPATALEHVLAGQMNVLKGLDTRISPPRIHIWSFLQPEVSFTFSATATGTADGQGSYSETTELTTLTATSATFDNSMIGHNITFTTSEEAYVISAVTSTTVAVLTGDASAEASGDTFSVNAKGYHSTPTAFRGIIEPPVFAWSASGNRYDMVRETPTEIRRRWRDSNTTGNTAYWAVENTTFDTTAIQAYRFMVAPVPSEDMVASMRIKARVPDPAAGAYFPGGELVSMAIRDAALADVELINGGKAGVWAGKAQTSLWAAIDADDAFLPSHSGAEQARVG